ncbi:hypothetical protein EXN66_Car020410 [Channa argus]|uniref:Uncharacterized protein n=1 Tax=Channa argus TaxID=215402 RepID=A0A6G1QPS2_CHAAH|nr:hypothetical protein EXN66_Car020410 [Channa argus]
MWRRGTLSQKVPALAFGRRNAANIWRGPHRLKNKGSHPGRRLLPWKNKKFSRGKNRTKKT